MHRPRILTVLIGLTLAATASPLRAQSGNTVTIQAAGAPIGLCPAILRYIDITNNLEYFCSNAAWYTSGGVGSAAFSGITSGSNTQAAMLIGTGSSLAATGTGTIDATTLGTHAASFFQNALGYTPLNPASNLTDVSNTATALSSLGGQTKLGSTSTTVSMGGTSGTKALVYVNTTAPLNLSKPFFDGTDWQTAASSISPNAQTATYAVKGMDNAAPDLGKLITQTSASITLAQAGTGSPVKFPSGFFFWVKNINAAGGANVTITATTSTFDNGAVTLVIFPQQQCLIASDGTNYHEGCSSIPTPFPTPASSITLVGPRAYFVCTTTCTVTLPVPKAGYEFCVFNDDNVSTAITLAALGSSAMYENSARTAYGTAGTGTLVVGAAAANKVCVVGRDATHYLTVSYSGVVTVN